MAALFRNHYYCDKCDERWTDDWSCQCDDECPSCGKDFSPTHSEDIDEDGNSLAHAALRSLTLELIVAARAALDACEQEADERRNSGNDEEHERLDETCNRLRVAIEAASSELNPTGEPAEPSRYLLVVWGDTEPELQGPYQTDDARLEAARAHRETEGDENGLYMLNAWGRVDIDGYPGCAFEPETETTNS